LLYASPGSQSPSKPVQRIAQRQQIGAAKAGSSRRNQTELIRRVDIGERACDRAKPPICTGVDHPVFAPMTAPADQLEGAAVQRMKRMRDPHLEVGLANTARS
jgi:hypothetical protein